MNNKNVILAGILVLTLGILILINLDKLSPFSNNEKDASNSIQIVSAEHLDVNRSFVENIYDALKSKDNIWSNEINNGEYVRILFEKNLTSVDDITIYPIVTYGNPLIEVYEKNKDKVIVSFRDIINNSYNKVFLRDLIKSQDEFDLKVINGSIKFDHIIDPTVTEVFFDSLEDGISWTYWTEVSGTGWSNVNLCPTNCADGAQCACAENGAINALQLTNSLDLTPYSECTLTYSRYVDRSFDNGEYYYVNVTDSGGNFVNIFSCTNGQTCEDNTWDTEIYNITSGVGLNNNFKIRVTASKNDLNEEAGFDFVNVTCMTSDSNAPLVTINFPETNAEYSRLLDLPLLFNISLNENGVANYTLDNGLTNISMSSEDGLNFNASSGDLDFGDYTLQFYAQDSNGNANYTTNVSFSVVQQYALVNGTVLDSNGNPLNAKVTIYDEIANSFIYNETGDNLTAIIPINSTYTIRVFPLDIDYIDRIRFDNVNLTEQNITDTSMEIAKLDRVSNLDNLFSVFSIDPLLDNLTNYTVFFTAESAEMRECPSWNFTDQSCSSGWEPFLHDLTPGQEYNITLPSGNSAFGFVELTKALHLDENRTIISDIFDSVRQIDGIWSETISDTHYVRIAFNKNLTSSNDITIYPRTISGTPMITVYEEDGTNQIVNFTSITDNQYNTVFLTNLGGKSQSVFDLLISGGDLQFDHIIDPLVSETLVPNAVSQPASNGTHTDTGGFAIQRTSLLSSTQINRLNTSNNIAFRPLGESASLDTFVFVNFTVPSNEAITRIFLTVRSNTTVANHMKGMALWNFTSGGWRRVNFSAGAIGVLNTTTYNLSVSEMNHFVSNGKFRLMAYQNSTATGGFGVDFMSADVVYEKNIPPVTNLNAPSNGTTVTDPTISFNATFSDNFALRNTSLYIWNSTGDIINTTDATIVGLADSTNITVTLPYAGTYVWNYLTFDNATNGAMNSTNFTITYSDITPPQVTINSPANDTLNPPILFNVTLNKDGSACNFTLTNGKLNYTMQNNGNRDFNATNSTISDGSYVAKYFCWDLSNNLNSTTNVTFSALNLVNTYSINLTSILRINGSNYRIGDLFKNSNLEILLNSQFGKFRGLFKTNSDNLNIANSNTRFGGLFRINTQRLTIDNAVTRLLGIFRINSQTIAVDNSNTKYSGIFRVNQDSLGFNLGIARTYGANRIASNSIGLSDSVNRFLGIFRINNNNIGIAESNTRLGGIFRINNQEFVLGENTNKFSGLFRINQQTISLDESSYRLLGLFRIQLQVINVNEVLINVQSILKYFVELVQQFNLNNSVERLARVFKLPTNLLSIDSISSRTYSTVRANIQDLSISSIANRIAGIFRINNNNIGITETNARFGGLFRIMGQQLNLVGSNSRFSGLFRINSQTLTIDNSNTRFSGLFRLNSQRLTIDNSVTRLLNLFRINQQGINVNEKNTRFSGLFKVNAQTLTLDNAVTRLLGIFRINSQTIAVDNSNTKYSGIFRVNQDSLGFNLGIARTYGANRIASNSIGLSDSVNRFLGMFRINSQTLTIDNSNTRFLGIFRTQYQTISIGEVIGNIGSVFKYLVNLAQQLNIENTVERLAGIFKIPTNLLSIDSISSRTYSTVRANIQDLSISSIANRIAGIFRINNNNIGITESNTRFGGLFRIMGQQLNLVGSNSRFSGLFRINSQNIAVYNTPARFSGLFRLNSQRLTIDNSVSRLLNLFRINQQGINVNEKNTRFSGLFRINLQTLTLDNANAKYSGIFRINTQRLTIDNAVTRLLGIFRINSQTIAVDNSNTRYSGLFRINQDSLGFSLGIARTYGANRIASNSMGLVDSVNRFLSIFRTPTQVVNVRAVTNLGAEIFKYVIQLIERINLNETINRLANLIRTSSINVNIAESNTRFSGLFRLNSQRLTIDNAVNRLSYLFRSTDDSFTLNLGFRGNLGANRVNYQVVGLNVASERIGNVFRLPSNLISFNFNLERFFGANREISNGISLEDYASRFSGIFRISSTNIGLSDSLYKQTSRVRVAIQDLSIANSVTRFSGIFRIQTQQIIIEDMVSRVGGVAEYLIELVQRLSLTNSTQRSSHILKGFSDLMRLFFGLFSDKNLPTGGNTGGSGGGSGGSGGGSGGSFFGSSNSLGRITRTIDRELFESSRKSFSIGSGQVHHITLNGFSGSKAVFVIESHSEVFTLDIEETKNFDFNKDGLDDLSVKLISMDESKNSAFIELTPLSGADRLKEILLSPQNIKVSLKQGQTSTRELTIENTGNRNMELNLEVSGLNDQLRLSETEINLEPGMSKTIKIDFIIREDASPELYIGKITAKAKGFEDEVLVAIDASSKGALFDIKTEILDGRIISPGGKILASVQIFNLGDVGEVDVVVYYSIKDTITGQIYDLDHETVAVSTQTSLLKTINVPKELTRGVYLLNVKAVYPSKENDGEDSIVNASTWFSIASYQTYIIYFVIIAILLAGIVYSIRYLKRNGFFSRKFEYYQRNIQSIKSSNLNRNWNYYKS